MAKKIKMEFSKKIFMAITIFVFTSTIFSYFMSWVTRDTAILIELNRLLFAEFAIGTGFYYTKAKAENVRKIDKNCNIEEENING
ncbi:MAG: hypothetical protein WCO84_01315 [bacterium]